MVQHPRAILALFLIVSMTSTEAIKREPQCEAIGTTAAPTPTDRTAVAQRTPGGGTSMNHDGRKPIFPTSLIGQTAREPSDRP